VVKVIVYKSDKLEIYPQQIYLATGAVYTTYVTGYGMNEWNKSISFVMQEYNKLKALEKHEPFKNILNKMKSWARSLPRFSL
jgi:hypothetical protein